ncbi:MAG TPA: 2-oxo-4-hydroxy-4-carboxy-5-ureidoimidazoline decarboxylase [Pyrinomonadaceae bacterium]|nr:2-oxo-4-hydroxy-4-carboxy-5-ureidoimidazoline decarboxylase [Pyrinomonadaceae bacterium]
MRAREGTEQGLERLNALVAAEAESELLKCCGSTGWARALASRRPFADAEELTAAADEIWWSLGEEDWLEAFAAHPKIGGRKAARPQDAQAEGWSAQEQSGVSRAEQATLDELAAANRAYEEKFGHIFIVCATGKTATEMLNALHARLPNDPGVELRNAVDEQRKITRLRLEKLLTT